MIEVDYKIMVVGTRCGPATAKIRTKGLDGFQEIELRQETGPSQQAEIILLFPVHKIFYKVTFFYKR
jgi:hypothetical protein